MAAKLASLRTHLADLRARRRMVRWGMALTALLLALLVLLSAVFALDWSFDMTRLQRALTVLLGVGLFYWTYRRFARPWLSVRESEIDMALRWSATRRSTATWSPPSSSSRPPARNGVRPNCGRPSSTAWPNSAKG